MPTTSPDPGPPTSWEISHNTSPVDISHISGNASPEIKRSLTDPRVLVYSSLSKPRFAESIGVRLRTIEASFVPNPEEPRKMQGRVVMEITVEDDMTNGTEMMHGGCAAYLIDLGSGLVLMVHKHSNKDEVVTSGVSQPLNIVYHSPATVGDKLRIVNTSTTIGARSMSAKTEIWNATHHRLVASGIHVKMYPSPPPSKL